MTKFFEEIKSKINNKFCPEKLELIDNSYLHTGHKYFEKEKFHIKLEIKSNDLNVLSRVDAQKKIMNILKDDLKKKIHALEIKIK